VSDSFGLKYLQDYGYSITNPAGMNPENRAVVTAFQAHFSRNQRPHEYGASLSREDMRWIWGLRTKYADQGRQEGKEEGKVPKQ
jgi:hypothetical protein